MTPIARFSIIDYLNALPLNLAFKDGLYRDRAELIFDFPSQCADNLASGQADVGLISSIEYQRIPGLIIAPHIAIASRKEVRSVLILTKKDLADVRLIALDRFSRSSVALLRLLLHRRYGSRPHFLSMTPDPKTMLHEADAALIIGDAALAMPCGDYQVIDLATEWYRETQLPFVFAFWAMRSGTPVDELSAILLAAKKYGQEQLPHRLDEIRKRWDLPAEDILAYLTTNIHYDLEDDERASLALFYRYAFEARLIDHVKEVRFAEG